MSSTNGGQETREEQLRHHVAQLKEEVEKEKAEKRQIHQDKVREVKATRELEQANAREQLEKLKAKLQNEKAQELQEQREKLSIEFKTRMKSLERLNEDNMNEVKIKHCQEKQELTEKLRAELSEELRDVIGSKFESDRRKMQHEIFELQHQLTALKNKNADLIDGDRNTASVLRDVDKQHRNDVEMINKQHRLALKKQMEELESMNRKLKDKQKEMAKLSDRLTRADADKDKLQDEIKHLKQAESWTRRSTTPPSLSPSSSMNDLVSKRERDMVMKNSELSFRVRTLEDNISLIRAEKAKLQANLKESRQQLAPLEQQKMKLSHRINDLNSLLRSREKKIEEMSKSVLELKSSKQQLEEETMRQRKSLQQQMSQSSAHRAEKEKLRSKNLKLSQTNTSLSDELENIRSENKDMQERLILSSPPMSPSHPSLSPHSPRPLSPTSSLGDGSPLSSSAGSSILLEQLDQLQFDKEESEVKYDEMKSEYVDLRDKYKNLVTKYEELQEKYRDQQRKNKLLRDQLTLVKKEHLELEHEVALLRRAENISPSHDVKRFDSIHKQLEEKEKRICELEDFIVEQDEVAQKSEEVLEKEKKDVQIKLAEITETNKSLSVQMQELSQRVSVLERELEHANKLLKLKETEIEQLQQRLPATSEPQPYGEEDEYEVSSSPLSAAQLQQCVHQYKTQINHLDEKNMNLQRDLEDAVAQVGELQGITVELEGRLEESERVHEEEVTNRDEDIHLLNQRLTQMETKIKRLKSSLPVDVDENEVTEVVDKVVEATRRVKAAADEHSNTLKSELTSLEETIKDLIRAVLPDYVWPTPPRSETSCSHESQLQEDTESSLRTSEGESILSTSSISAEQVSTDFTDLPLTYDKVIASQQTPPTSSFTTTPPDISFGTHQPPYSDESVDGSLQLPLRISPVDPPQSIHSRSQGRPHGIDKSLQTSRPVMRERSSQTPATKKPTMRDKLTQTSSARTSQQSTQTSYTRRIITANKSSQTLRVIKPKLVDCSSQTRKHIPAENLPHSMRYRLAEHSTQTPRSWMNMADFSTTPVSCAGLMEDSLPQTPPQIKDWSKSPAHRSLTQGRLLPYHNGTFVDTSWRSPTSPLTSNEEGKPNKMVDEVPRVFVAVMDYDPNSLCTSGKPELELCFHTGDVLSVEGDMDENGYYYASFGGESGLVPANFVQETEVADFTTRERLFNQTLSHNLSIVGCHGSPLPKSQHQSPLIHYQLPKGEGSCPQSPLSLHVEKVIGQDGLLVAWQPPPMDGMCRSNGCLVTGYHLYVNGETKALVSGSSQSRTLLHGVPVMKTLRLGISTSSIEGKCSKVMEIVYHGRPLSISSTSPEPETLSMYVALNDYDPIKSSPNEHPEFELPFKEGDLIKVHGKEKDGFVVGELNGKQGWVPATFVTPVSGLEDKGKSPSKSLSCSLGQPISSRRMFALYDYDPVKSSPNPNPDAELAFKAGDIITVYGNMHGDGYYSGELGERFGLVPSNFLQELNQSADEPRNKVKGQANHQQHN